MKSLFLFTSIFLCVALQSGHWQGAVYQKNSRPQQEWFEQVVSALQLKGNEEILDIGCGDGAISNKIAYMIPQGNIIGIDISKSMIECARENYQTERISFMF
ncbi:MAG: methyltransferase domain-containing protein [Myxococcales bacterium]|nr:MAG: methyltransferase domain-containing protein [Myxococcales bacterium]